MEVVGKLSAVVNYVNGDLDQASMMLDPHSLGLLDYLGYTMTRILSSMKRTNFLYPHSSEVHIWTIS